MSRTLAGLSCLLALSAVSLWADVHNLPVFDDFEDGDYTANPTWTVGGVPGATQSVVLHGGSNALEMTLPIATPPYDNPWSAAGAAWTQGDQGIYSTLDLVGGTESWGGGVVVRYNPSAPGAGNLGTGYAAIIHRVVGGPAPGFWFSLVELAGEDIYNIATPQFLGPVLEPMWVEIVSYETGASTYVLAGTGPLSQPIPPTWWTLDSRAPGPGGVGLTNYYNGGFLGVVAGAENNSSTVSAYYDNVRILTPEPTSASLVLVGLGVVAAWRRRRQAACG